MRVYRDEMLSEAGVWGSELGVLEDGGLAWSRREECVWEWGTLSLCQTKRVYIQHTHTCQVEERMRDQEAWRESSTPSVHYVGTPCDPPWQGV